MDVVELPTGAGTGRLHHRVPDAPRRLVLLGAGASGSLSAADLVALADRLPTRGIGVCLFEQPWHVAGRRVGPRAPLQDPAFAAARTEVGRRWAGVPVFVGGRSAGARVACRTHVPDTDAGVVALSFPLHPPGRPEATRIGELAAVEGPVLVVCGDRDPYGSPDELRDALTSVPQAGERRLVLVPGAAHSFRPGHTGPLVAAVEAFVAPV